MYYCFAVKVRLTMNRQRLLTHSHFRSGILDEDEEQYEKYTEVKELEFPVCSKTTDFKNAVMKYVAIYCPSFTEVLFANPITASEFAERSAV